jgi:hypothetical protein
VVTVATGNANWLMVVPIGIKSQAVAFVSSVWYESGFGRHEDVFTLFSLKNKLY